MSSPTMRIKISETEATWYRVADIACIAHIRERGELPRWRVTTIHGHRLDVPYVGNEDLAYEWSRQMD